MSEDVFAPDVPTLVARIEAFIGPIGDYAAKVRAVLRGFSDAKARKAA